MRRLFREFDSWRQPSQDAGNSEATKMTLKILLILLAALAVIWMLKMAAEFLRRR
jgi:hypothetical protein